MHGDPAELSTRLIELERERLIDFVETATIGLHWVGGDGTILWANRADYEPLGYSADEYIGHNIADLHADADAIEDILARLKRGERLDEYPARLRCRDGSIRHVRITSSVLFDDDGNFVNTRCFTRDVTAEHAAQERLHALAEASQCLSSSLDLETTLTSLARFCVPRLADWCEVEIRAEDGTLKQLAVAHVDPEKAELARELHRQFPPESDAPWGAPRVLRTGKPMYVEDVSEALIASAAHSEEHERLIRALAPRSFAVVPIPQGGSILAALTLVSTKPERRYGPSDVAFAQELSGRAAQAIENARLYQNAETSRREAEDAVKRMGLLADLSEMLAFSLDPDRALEDLVRFITSTMADYCIAYRLEDGGEIHRAAAAHRDPDQQHLVEELLRIAPPTLETYGAGTVLKSGEPSLAREIRGELLEATAQNAEHLRVLRQLAPRSSIVLPLRARDRVLGALAFATTDYSERRYTEADLLLAQEVAARAALLVDNARLYRQAQEATGARDLMLSIVSHDLRNPLNTIVTACEVLELDPPEERRNRARAGIRRAAKQMHRLLQDLLDVARLDEGRLTIEATPLDLCDLLVDLSTLHSPVAEDRGIRLVTTAPRVSFLADRQRLSQALSNLVDNALKFTPDGGEVRVVGERAGDEVRITVEDTGPGISDEQRPRLFERFWRGTTAGDKGFGLGLSISKGVVEAHGGRIEVTSAPGGGARFVLTLPGRAERAEES